MGDSYKHLKGLVPGVSHHLQSKGGGSGSPLPQAEAAHDVPRMDGHARTMGNRADGPRANIAPSMCNDGKGDCSKK